MSKQQISQVEVISQEIGRELSNESVGRALLATTFKGLTIVSMKQALMEGMIRGFTFKDFMEKNVYAVPFGGTYSLVTSVDFARKKGMRGGIVGKSAPEYEEKDGKLISCTVTVKRKVGEHIGDYTAKVYFDEYTTGRNLWATKPRTMLAKVAEMHALRMACPEELSQSYIEEEMAAESETFVQKARSAGTELTMGNFNKEHGKENGKAQADEGTQNAPSAEGGDIHID